MRIRGLDGRRMQSVTGGTRWGGGIWINSFDHVRFGLLLLRGGKWRDRTLLSEEWITRATTRGNAGPDYGYLWWLDAAGRAWWGSPKSAYRASGHGSNTVWIDPEHDLVFMWGWHRGRALSEFLRQIVESAVAGAMDGGPLGFRGSSG